MTSTVDAYVYLWVGLTLMCLLGLSAVFVWAWKAGQFGNQDRARWLALWAEVPTEDAAPPHGEHRQDRDDAAAPGSGQTGDRPGGTKGG